MKRLLTVVSVAFGMVACSPAPVVRVEDPITPVPTPTPAPSPTPHPAAGARARAIQMYPDLAKPDTLFNQTFRDVYVQELTSNPTSLQSADWPLGLARKTALMLNIDPVPDSTPAPTTPVIRYVPVPVPVPVATPRTLERRAF